MKNIRNHLIQLVTVQDHPNMDGVEPATPEMKFILDMKDSATNIRLGVKLDPLEKWEDLVLIETGGGVVEHVTISGRVYRILCRKPNWIC